MSIKKGGFLCTMKVLESGQICALPHKRSVVQVFSYKFKVSITASNVTTT